MRPNLGITTAIFKGCEGIFILRTRPYKITNPPYRVTATPSGSLSLQAPLIIFIGKFHCFNSSTFMVFRATVQEISREMPDAIQDSH